MGPEAVHELTAAYALDALDADERREYEAHLSRCERCRDDLAAFSEAATSLAYAVDSPAPPLQLRDRILASARAERPNVVPLRPRWALPAAAAAVVAVAAAVALAIWGVSLSNKLDHERTARSDQARVEAVLSAPDARSYTIANRGRLVVAGTGQAVLVLDRLAPADDGMTYEAWVAQGPQLRPAGTFAAGGNLTAVALDRPVPSGGTVMVTQEKDGGTAQPTHKPFIKVNTAA